MSYILDALRKSESERQREATASLSRAPLAPVRHRVPFWTWLLIAVLSVALIGLAAAWLQSSRIPAPALTSNETEYRDTGQPPVDSSAQQPAPPAADSTSGTEQPLLPIEDLGTLEPSLPAYRLELIAYNSQDPTASSAWINGRRYYVGESVGAGPELVEVRPDSVVLGYSGSQFLLTTR